MPINSARLRGPAGMTDVPTPLLSPSGNGDVGGLVAWMAFRSLTPDFHCPTLIGHSFIGLLLVHSLFDLELLAKHVRLLCRDSERIVQVLHLRLQ